MKQWAMGMSVVTESESSTILIDAESPLKGKITDPKKLSRYHASLQSVPQSSHEILRSV